MKPNGLQNASGARERQEGRQEMKSLGSKYDRKHTYINVWIDNLGICNEGGSVGGWVSLPQSDETLEKICSDITDELHDEVFIADYECFVPGVKISQYTDIDYLNECARELEELDDYQIEIVSARVAMLDEDLGEAIDGVDNAHVFCNCDSMEDVAREDIEESGLLRDVPEELADYFDYERWGRDLEINGYYYKAGNDIVEVW